MSPESPSKASSGSTQTSNSGGESTAERDDAAELARRRVVQVASLESQLAASQAALRKYGRHELLCSAGTPGPVRRRLSGGTFDCTCGLDAALQSLPERPAIADVVSAAAERFDKRPIERASVEARAELERPAAVGADEGGES